MTSFQNFVYLENKQFKIVWEEQEDLSYKNVIVKSCVREGKKELEKTAGKDGISFGVAQPSKTDPSLELRVFLVLCRGSARSYGRSKRIRWEATDETAFGRVRSPLR